MPKVRLAYGPPPNARACPPEKVWTPRGDPPLPNSIFALTPQVTLWDVTDDVGTERRCQP